MRRSILVITIGLFVCLGGSGAQAEPPEYLQLELRAGITLEIKGYVSDAGLFVATDLETIDGPRSPKIRAKIERIDERALTGTLLGQDIVFSSKTDYDAGTFDSFQGGQFIEVKCRVDEDGVWQAKSVETLNIKPANKLKVTLTRTAIDSTPPDTLEVSGFRILLVEETDVELAANRRADDLDIFRELAYADAASAPKGYHTDDGRHLFLVDYRHNFRSETDYDLSARFDADRDDTQPEIRLGWAAYWTESLRTMAQLRMRKNYVVSGETPDSTGGLEMHFIQLVALWSRPAELPVSLLLGRQRFRDPREWLFDEYLDSARGFLHMSPFQFEFAVVRAVEHFKPKFASWTDVYGDLSVEVAGGDATAYVLARHDSDTTRKRDSVYYGLRYYGRPTRSWRLSGDLSFLRGEDKGRTMDAWAVDLAATYRMRKVRFEPFASVGFALGSGEQPGGTGVDGRYRQTGYQDNTDRIGGVTQVRYYGTLLDPELSNLIIWTGSVGFRPHNDVSLQLIYHTYAQQYAEDQLRSLLIDPPARPNGVDTDIGQGLDFVIGTRHLWNHVRFSWTTSLFFPGEAFAPRQERATLNRIELRLTL
jgi:hypothetical protein